MELFSVVLVFFFIMDPVGNIASFMALLKDLEPKRQRVIILREMLIALAIMIAFNFLGDRLQCALDLKDATIYFASGVILFLAALGILFPGPRSIRLSLPEDPNPILIPLAVPLIAGPSLLATIMLYASEDTTGYIVLTAIVIAWALAVLVLLSSRFLTRVLGKNGLMASERLIAMVLVMIAIQRVLEGVQVYRAAS